MNRVLVPVIRGIVFAQIEKGRHWSAIEHLVLHTIATSPKSVEQLAKETSIHRSVLGEIIVRLMSVGWLELAQHNNILALSVTSLGSIEVENRVLTPIIQVIWRNIYFDIDCITWTLHKSGGFSQMYFEDQVREIWTTDSNMVLLKSEHSRGPRLEGTDLIQLIAEHRELLKNDERIVGYDPIKSNLNLKYASIIVTEGTIEQIPSSSCSSLKTAILAASDQFTMTENDKGTFEPFEYLPSAQQISSKKHDFSDDEIDIIVGGPNHRKALEHVLSAAKEYVVIASTFIRKEVIVDLLPNINEAAGRGVEVYLVWNSSDPGEQEWTVELDTPENVKILGINSESHAKIILADDGNGQYFGVVGSCNWLYSNFQSLEVSARIRTPAIVRECIRFLEIALKGNAELQNVLLEVSHRNYSSSRSSINADENFGTVQLVIGSDHTEILHKARDESSSSITLSSNRLGNTVESQGLIALDMAAKRGIVTTVYFQRVNSESAYGQTGFGALMKSYSRINAKKVKRDHAKLLCWDDDDIVITSLNWLSKDALSGTEVSELGVYLTGPEIAKKARQEFEAILENRL